MLPEQQIDVGRYGANCNYRTAEAGNAEEF